MAASSELAGRGVPPRGRPKQERTRLRAFAGDKVDALDLVLHVFFLDWASSAQT
jgi:hypothetical protein